MSIFKRPNETPEYPSHIYYDLNMINNDTTGQNPPLFLKFNEIRNSPVLQDPSQYFLSIIRFSLDTPSLPLFIPQVILNQPNPRLLIYTITMTYDVGANTITNQENIIFEAQDVSQPVPRPPLTAQDVSSEFYFIYSYQHWIRNVNQCITTCFNNLKTKVITAGGTLPTDNIPFMKWDNPTCTATIYADKAGFDNALANPILFYMNTPLYTLFSSFEATYYGYSSNVVFGENFLINIYDNGTNSQTIGTYTALVMQQEYSTSPLWNPVQAITFNTSLIPVNPDLVSVPKVYNSNQALFNVGNNSNIDNVLTDFQVSLMKGNEWKPNIYYSPQSEYRLVQLNGNNPLSSIELTVFWRDAFSNLHPFNLTSGCTGTVKILFRKKSFNGL